MSKAFTAKPSGLSSRSQSQPRGRGVSTPSTQGAAGTRRRPTEFPKRASDFASSGSTRPKPSGNNSIIGGGQFGGAGRGSAARGSQGGRGVQGGRGGSGRHFESPRGRMNPHQPTSTGRGYGDTRPPPQKPEDTEPSQDQSGQHTGAFTMFAPNEQRRQKISQMAQKETKAYERYKQENSGQTFNYVGTVGGGDLSEDQARNRQANAVRAQKFNRQMRQAEMREETRRAEDQEIERNRLQARQMAEQNSVRQAAPAAEVRRRREAFLQQVEATSQPSQDTPAQQQQHRALASSTPPRATASLTAQSKNKSPAASSRPQGVSRVSQAASNTLTSRQSSHTQARPNEVRVKSEPGLATHVKLEATHDFDSNLPPDSQSSEGLDLLYGMFSSLDKDYLFDLLQQMGSVDSVIEVLNG